MTRDDVIRLAREAGFEVVAYDGVDEVLESDRYHIQTYPVERFAALVAAQEREECAQLCDQMEKDAEGTDCCKWPTPTDCAYAIRARSKE